MTTPISLLKNRRTVQTSPMPDGGTFYGRPEPAPAYKLGQALVGVAAPFVGNMDFALQQQKLKQQQDEADMEFQKFLMSRGKDQAVENYYNSIAGAFEGSTGAPGSLSALGNLDTEGYTDYSPEDYILKKKETKVRGIPTLIDVPELKPDFSDSQLKSLNDSVSVLQILDDIEKTSPKMKTGAFSGRFDQNIPFNQKYMALMGTPEEAQFKSDLTDLSTTYASAKTGAQRGFKEIQWLSSAIPTGDLPSDKLTAVASKARERMSINMRNMLISAEKNGVRLGGYRSTLNELIKQYPLDKHPFGAIEKKDKPKISDEKKVEYNKLRASGMSKEEAMKKAGF